HRGCRGRRTVAWRIRLLAETRRGARGPSTQCICWPAARRGHYFFLSPDLASPAFAAGAAAALPPAAGAAAVFASPAGAAAPSAPAAPSAAAASSSALAPATVAIVKSRL